MRTVKGGDFVTAMKEEATATLASGGRHFALVMPHYEQAHANTDELEEAAKWYGLPFNLSVDPKFKAARFTFNVEDALSWVDALVDVVALEVARNWHNSDVRVNVHPLGQCGVDSQIVVDAAERRLGTWKLHLNDLRTHVKVVPRDV